jgi:hypothetical protein
MTPRAEGYSLGAGAIRLLQSPLPRREGSALFGKVTRRDDLSGLLVAVLDNQPTDKRTYFSTRGLGSAHAPPASGRKVINHLSPLPVACRHAALLFRTTRFGGAPSDAKCGRQPLSNGENAVVGTTALCEVGRRAFFYGKIEAAVSLVSMHPKCLTLLAPSSRTPPRTARRF